MCAYPMVGDEPVAVVLPDVILDEYSADPRKDNLHDMLQRFEATGVSQIMVEPVPHKDVGNYGVADCKGVDLQPVKARRWSAWSRSRRRIKRLPTGDCRSLRAVRRYLAAVGENASRRRRRNSAD